MIMADRKIEIQGQFKGSFTKKERSDIKHMCRVIADIMDSQSPGQLALSPWLESNFRVFIDAIMEKPQGDK